MRWMGVLIGSLAAVVSGAATAAVPDAALSRQALFGAAFASPSPLEPATVEAVSMALFAPGLGVERDDLGEARYVPGQGLLRFTTGQVASFGGGGQPYVDSIRFSTIGHDPRPGAAFLRPGAGTGFNSQGFDVAYVRNWPQAFTLDAGRVSFDVTPHAGFGVLSGGGRSAEAGALLRLQRSMLKAVGMGGAGQPGRLYLFAGASGRAVGYAVAHNQVAMGPDPEDGFVSDAQAGIGYQRGAVQASFGFSHQSMRLDALGDESRIDNRVGLRVSIH